MSASAADAGADAPAGPAPSELVPLDATDTAPVPVSPLPFFLGRHDDCHLVLRGEGILRKHAKIRWAAGTYFISDLATYQGTYVNGEAIVEVPLKDGDIVRIGPNKLTFRLAAAPARAGASGSLKVSPELSAAGRAEAAPTLGALLGTVPWWAWLAAGLALFVLGVGVTLELRRRRTLELRRAPVSLPALALAAGESAAVDLPWPPEVGAAEERVVVIDDPVVAGAAVVPDGLVVEAINPGQTRIAVQVRDFGPRLLAVTVAAPADPLETFPELKGILALGPAARVERAQAFLDHGDRAWSARDDDLGGRSAALDAFKKATVVLESLPHKPTLLEDARKKRDETKRDLDREWERHYFNMVQAFRVGDRVKCQQEAVVLLQLFPESSTQRNAIARVYLDRLRR